MGVKFQVMQIIENFLPEDVHKEYFEHYHSLNPTWRFVQKANSNADDTGNTYFMNETYHDTWKDKDGNPFKPAWEVVKLIEYLPKGYSKIIRPSVSYHWNTHINNFWYQATCCTTGN